MLRRDTRDFLYKLRRVHVQVLRKRLKAFCAVFDILGVVKLLFDDHVGHGIQDRDVGAYPQLHVSFGPTGQLNFPRVYNDQVGASPDGFFHPERYNGVRLCGVGTDHEEHVCAGDFLD